MRIAYRWILIQQCSYIAVVLYCCNSLYRLKLRQNRFLIKVMNTHNNFNSNCSFNRSVTSSGFLLNLMKRTKPKLAFDPDMTASEFVEWQEKVRAKLKELMNFPAITPQPAPKKLFEEKRTGYRLEKWELYPEDGCAVPFLVLVPDIASEKSPVGAVLCMPGSNGTKELLAGEPELTSDIPPNKHPEHNKMAFWYAQKGFVAIAVDNPVTGETSSICRGQSCGGSERVSFSFYALQLGRSYLGISVFHKLKILEWAKEQPFIDSRRIAVSGHSLGTEPAMILANLFPEISAIVFNDYLCDFRKMAIATCLWSAGIWHIVPGMLDWFDFPDLLAACAPKPLLISEGGPMADLQKVQSAYRLMNAEDKFKFYFLPPYDDASNRRDEIEELPEGISLEEYLTLYANVNTSEHYFKEQLAVPWLCSVFS